MVPTLHLAKHQGGRGGSSSALSGGSPPPFSSREQSLLLPFWGVSHNTCERGVSTQHTVEVLYPSHGHFRSELKQSGTGFLSTLDTGLLQHSPSRLSNCTRVRLEFEMSRHQLGISRGHLPHPGRSAPFPECPHFTWLV